MRKVLLVDDNIDIINLIAPHFLNEGFAVEKAYNGKEALDKFDNSFDIVLLDIMMPIIDGIEACKRIRKISNVPIIIITAKSTDEDIIMGIDVGADDYIVKPFSPIQVLAKAKALLRRIKGTHDGVIIISNLMININEYIIKIDGDIVPFTKKEIEILYLLAKSPKRVYPREVLLDTLWGIDYYGDIRTVDTHIKRIRAKLGNKTDKVDIKTVWGVGYKFESINE